MRTLTLPRLILLTLFVGSLPAASAQRNDRPLLEIERSHGCATDAAARINRLKGLFDEAIRQLKRAPAGSAAHRDALRTIEVLEEQLRTAASELLRCIPKASQPEPEPEVVSTGEGNSMVRESGRVQLSTRVSLVKGERIDGKGRHRSGEIARALSTRDGTSFAAMSSCSFGAIGPNAATWTLCLPWTIAARSPGWALKARLLGILNFKVASSARRARSKRHPLKMATRAMPSSSLSAARTESEARTKPRLLL